MGTKFENLGARMIRDLMKEFSGLKDFQAAGVPGNGGGESLGFTLAFEQNPTVKGSKGGSGMFQWTGYTDKSPRRRNWEAWLRAHGKDPNNKEHVLDYDMNYGFLIHELQTSERSTIPALMKAKDEVDATRIFMEKFERPGKPHFQGRVMWTKQALAAYRKSTTWDTSDALKKKDAPIKGDLPAGTSTIALPVVVGGGLYAWLKGLSFGEWGLIALVFGAILAALYWFVIRPILKRFDELKPVFNRFDTEELSWWSRAQLTVKGMKSYLWGRLLAITGGATALLSGTGFFDVSTILPPIIHEPWNINIPASMYVPGFLLPTLAWVNNKLAATRDVSPEELAARLTNGNADKLVAVEPVRVTHTRKRQKSKRKSR